MKILFYVSGHGLGHGTRAFAVMQALLSSEPTCQIYARTHLSNDKFAGITEKNFHLSDVVLDVGVVEKDIFSQDKCATLNRYSEIISSKDRILHAELNFIKQEQINVIVSDIPPLASDIGCAAGLPTIAIGNFSWDFIYEPYLRQYPAFDYLINEISTSYGKTELLLRLPFHHDMLSFPRRQDIPLTTRKPMSSPEKTYSDLGIGPDEQRSIVLIALRMSDAVPLQAVKELVESDEFIVLSFSRLPFQAEVGVKVLGVEWQQRFPDIVAISDVVVSKLGYGIVAECIAGQTSLVYIPRDDFAEYELITKNIDQALPSHLMPKEEFLLGNWYDQIKKFLSRESIWPSVRTDGAEVAAKIILSYVR